MLCCKRGEREPSKCGSIPNAVRFAWLCFDLTSFLTSQNTFRLQLKPGPQHNYFSVLFQIFVISPTGRTFQALIQAFTRASTSFYYILEACPGGRMQNITVIGLINGIQQRNEATEAQWVYNVYLVGLSGTAVFESPPFDPASSHECDILVC